MLLTKPQLELSKEYLTSPMSNLFDYESYQGKISKDSVQEGYINFLNEWNWEWYYTLTFNQDVHPEQANKLFIRWMRKQEITLYGRKHYKRNQFIRWVRTTEYQKRGTIHYHGLLNASDNFDQFQSMRDWENLDGIGIKEGTTGMARIFKAKQPAAEIYITKYVTKEINVDLSKSLSVCFGEYKELNKLDIIK
jgi:hypothetical protein